jgi:predicted Zn-dependent protease
MFCSAEKKTTKCSPRRQPRTLRCENLESRELFTTTYMILDFTPDSHAGSFVDTFVNTRLPNGYAPNFLDFNGDHWVNAADASIAAQRVAGRVAGFYSQAMKGLNVQVRYGDVTSNSNVGTQWINYGKYYSGIEVAVMYFGGTSTSGLGVLGMAPLANDGYNFEAYGETYTRSAAINMVQHTPNASPGDFVEVVARTAAHELGHMFGLRHIRGTDFSQVMNAQTPIRPTSASFANQSRYTEGGAAQNAFQELRSSFYNQRQRSDQPYIGGQFATVDFGSQANPAPSAAGQIDQAMASLMADGAGVMTLEGAQAVADAALALASTYTGQHRQDRDVASDLVVDQRRLLDQALASRETQSLGATTGQASPLTYASAGQDQNDGIRPLRQAKDSVFGSRFFNRDVLDSDTRISGQLESAAGVA